jgi:hypothetical protein
MVFENMVGFYIQTTSLSFPFATTAYVCFYLHMTTGVGCTAQSITIYLMTDASNYYYKTWSYTEAASGDYDKYEEALLSAFTVVGTPSLSDISSVRIDVQANGCWFYLDDLRVVNADPGDAGAPNDTGVVWDFEAGTWHIYELDGSTKYLGQIQITAATEMIAMIHTDYGGEIQYSARCMAKREEGQVGLVFRCSDPSAGSEDGYVLLLDTSADQLLLKEYVAGSASNVADPVSYTFAVDGEYYLGVIARGSNIECFVSTDQATLWQVSNRKFNLVDTTYATGQCGVISIGTIGRFTDIDLDSVGDIHVPDDQVDVTVYALYRTIYPFTD